MQLAAVLDAATVVGFVAEESVAADYVVVVVAALQESWQGVLVAVVVGDAVVDNVAGIVAAGIAAELVLEYEQVFHNPS